MNLEKMNEFQKRMAEYQKSFNETVSSTNDEITVNFNGTIQISSIQSKVDLNDEINKAILIETINTGIRNTSQKVSIGVKMITEQMAQQS